MIDKAYVENWTLNFMHPDWREGGVKEHAIIVFTHITHFRIYGTDFAVFFPHSKAKEKIEEQINYKYE